MRIRGFIWLDEVEEKLEIKHHVQIEEVEELFGREPKIRKWQRGVRFRGEDVYRALGQTESGRYLTVFFIYKLSHEALILSARDMDDGERKSYGR
jgi:uncharacterized protein